MGTRRPRTEGRDHTPRVLELVEYFLCQIDATNDVHKGFTWSAEEECRHSLSSSTMLHKWSRRCFPIFISAEQVVGMEEEWPRFRALSVGVTAKQDVLAFFKLHQKELPANVVCDLALVPSSSAACERVFSLLRHMFGNITRLHRNGRQVSIQQAKHLNQLN